MTTPNAPPTVPEAVQRRVDALLAALDCEPCAVTFSKPTGPGSRSLYRGKIVARVALRRNGSMSLSANLADALGDSADAALAALLLELLRLTRNAVRVAQRAEESARREAEVALQRAASIAERRARLEAALAAAEAADV